VAICWFTAKTFKLPGMLILAVLYLGNILFRECESLLPYALNCYYHFFLKDMHKRLYLFARFSTKGPGLITFRGLAISKKMNDKHFCQEYYRHFSVCVAKQRWPTGCHD